MNIKDYEYVVEIARRGSISKAAEQLCITQGALTKYLQRLENTLSTPIFHRVGNRFLPTKAGEVYLAKAKQIIDLDKELEDEISRLVSSREMAIRVGYPMGMYSFIMESLLPRFFQQFPKSCISLMEGSSQAIIQKVEEGTLDVCLAYASTRKTGLQYDELSASQMVLCVPADSPLISRAVRKEGYSYPVLVGTEWLEEPYISIAPHTRSGQAADRFFEQVGHKPNTRLYVDDTRSAMAAVEQKLGVCLLTAIPHTDRVIRYLYLPDLPVEMQTVYLVSRKSDNPSRAFSGLLELTHQLYLEF